MRMFEKMGIATEEGLAKLLHINCIDIPDDEGSSAKRGENDRKQSKKAKCTVYEDGCEEWAAGCPCIYYKPRRDRKR